MVYLAVLAVVGGFRRPDMDLLGQLLPVARLKERLPGLRQVSGCTREHKKGRPL